MNDVTTINKTDLPAHLQGGKKAKFGDVTQDDLIIPRIKLIQATNEELQAYDGLKIGDFFHTLLERSLGNKLRIIPLVLRKELVLWAPRGDDRGILARSRDMTHWDPGFENLEFEVKIKGQPKPVKYHTKGTVAESGLAEFGSGVPGDANSRPAASLTYRILACFPDFQEIGPALLINTRSAIKAAKGLISKIELRPVEHYGQVFSMGTTDEKGDEGPYKGYSYTSDGYANEQQFEWAKALYERFEPLDWKGNDESADVGDGSGGSAAPKNDATTRDVSDKTKKF